MNIDNKFLLVCLQLLIVVLMSMNVEGMPDVRKSVVNDSAQSDADPISRAYRLYNQCALKIVSIQERITTTDSITDENAILTLEAKTMGNETKPRIQIRGNGKFSGRYLCFNHKGKLVSRPRKKAEKNENCQFFEEPVEQEGFRFKSVQNSKWYIGFNRKGGPLAGAAHVETRREHCFHFNKFPIGDNNNDVEKHNQQISKQGQDIPGLDADILLGNSVTVHPFRHHHKLGNLSFGSSLRHRNPKKSHRNRKSLSRTTIER